MIASLLDLDDGNGNLIGDGTYSYCYDAESRMTGIVSAGTCTSPTTTVATYAYDAQGRRKSKTVGGTTTIYVTDADNRQVLEYDGSSGATQRWYAYGAGANDVLNQIDVASSSRLTMIPDIQGSIQATLSSAGTLAKAGYLAYGENTSAVAGTFRYTGQRLDPETGGSASQPSGLYYYRARIYSPTTGRFLQGDPIGYSGGGNLYAYVNNDPLNGTDPLGLYTFQLGVSGGTTLAVFGYQIAGFQASGGLAIDDSGGFRFYGSGTVGRGFGDSVKLGVQVAASNASTVSQLNGPSVNQSATYGEGLGGSIDYSHIAPGVGSIGFTAGLAAGAGYSASVGPTGLCSLTCAKDAISNLFNGGSPVFAPTSQPPSTSEPSSNATDVGGGQPISLK